MFSFFERAMKTIGLVGFGKLGQAVAAQILDSGFSVIAYDTDANLVTAFANNEFNSSEPGVFDSLKKAVQEKRLFVSAEPSSLSRCEALIICIPLLTQSDPGQVSIEFESFDRCMMAIARSLHDNMLISLETTVPVGTCRNRIVPMFESEGKVHGRDYLLAFSPERVQSGTMRSQLVTNPKIVSGITDDALTRATELYKSFLPLENVEQASSVEVAELIKLTAMVSRDLNIAFVNQMALFCDAAKVDIREVLKHINTDQVTHMLSPGIGVGGHCTPVYPHFLINNFAGVDLDFTLAREGRRLNDAMPEYIVDSICQEFPIERVLILGLGFRPNVKEDTCSPAYQLNQILQKRGIKVSLHDPLYTYEELTNKGFTAAENMYDEIYDAIFLVTCHHQYADLDFQRFAQRGCKIFVDGRNAIHHEKVLRNGMAYRGIGTGCYSPSFEAIYV
jgi:nucleotide sugar dehydrogenase